MKALALSARQVNRRQVLCEGKILGMRTTDWDLKHSSPLFSPTVAVACCRHLIWNAAVSVKCFQETVVETSKSQLETVIYCTRYNSRRPSTIGWPENWGHFHSHLENTQIDLYHLRYFWRTLIRSVLFRTPLSTHQFCKMRLRHLANANHWRTSPIGL